MRLWICDPAVPTAISKSTMLHQSHISLPVVTNCHYTARVNIRLLLEKLLLNACGLMTVVCQYSGCQVDKTLGGLRWRHYVKTHPSRTKETAKILRQNSPISRPSVALIISKCNNSQQQSHFRVLIKHEEKKVNSGVLDSMQLTWLAFFPLKFLSTVWNRGATVIQPLICQPFAHFPVQIANQDPFRQQRPGTGTDRPGRGVLCHMWAMEVLSSPGWNPYCGLHRHCWLPHCWCRRAGQGCQV